jgi:hypothetical protein
MYFCLNGSFLKRESLVESFWWRSSFERLFLCEKKAVSRGKKKAKEGSYEFEQRQINIDWKRLEIEQLFLRNSTQFTLDYDKFWFIFISNEVSKRIFWKTSTIFRRILQ